MFVAKAIALLVAMMVLLGSCAQTSEQSDGGSPAPAPSNWGPPSRDQVVTAMSESGDAKVAIKAKASMPEDFDDGQPERSFSGEGFIDRESGLAGITYDLSTVPNAAGYFGHAEGKTSVYYSDGRFLLSFRLLTEALGAELDWLRYGLADFAEPQIRKLGIGQLREIGLSDPLLALALLEGAPNEYPRGEPAVAQKTPVTAYEFDIEVGSAAQVAAGGMSELFEAVEELGLESVPARVLIDAQDRVRALTYDFTYPPAPGSEPVELSVTIRFLKFGMEGGLTPPRDRLVADYRTYVAP